MITKELVKQWVSAVADPNKVPPYQNDFWTLTDAEMQAFAALAAAHGAAQREAELQEQRDLMQQEIYTLNRLLKIAHDGPRIAALDAALRQARDALDVATNSLGSFTMDHGCSQVDFDNTDTALAALCTLNQILK